MDEKDKEPSMLPFYIGATVFIGGIIILYYIVFTTQEHEVVMNQFGDLEHRDNSFILPIQKLALVVLPIVGLYYLIKGRLKK